MFSRVPQLEQELGRTRRCVKMAGIQANYLTLPAGAAVSWCENAFTPALPLAAS
jgi:hypothetical protein